MCEFCHQHGEGKKWYFKAENYSQELVADLERQRYITNFVKDVGNGQMDRLEKNLAKGLLAPKWLKVFLYWFYERRYRRDHFGQVVPLEELRTVLQLASSIIRFPCICRKNSRGLNDACYCFGLSIDPEKILGLEEAFLQTFRPGPDLQLFETLSVDSAMELLKDFDREGLMHSLWTFKTPFIGAICNCDRADCLAMLAYRYDFHLFFRAEYVAQIEESACAGCRACPSLCQFGAIAFSAARRKSFIDPLRCFGCGVCRSGCEFGAISLIPRGEHPTAGGLW